MSYYIHPSSIIIGNVKIGHLSSIWPLSVLRGDVNKISIGQETNIQDGSICHVRGKYKPSDTGYPLIIGNRVSIGHRVCLHGCEVFDNVLIGINSVVLDGAIIESNCLIGANSLVPPGKRLLSGKLYYGSPVKLIRDLTEEEKAHILENAKNYVDLTRDMLGKE